MSDSGSNYDALKHSVQDSQSYVLKSSSESSEKSSTSSYDRSGSRGRPRKRKTTETLTSSQPGLKRLKFSYNDDYRGLLNSAIEEIASTTSPGTGNLLQESQIGVTVWSSEEKRAFFRALSRRGRQDIRGIATDVGSKSESEVYVYSDMLYKAAVDQQIYENCKNFLDTSKIEAALEIRGDCCAALDLAAEAVSALQQNEEERVEKKRHKELALLTPRIARWVEHSLVVPEGGKEEVSNQIPAASLLKLMNFLALSKRFFMNSVIAEDNWRSYTGKKTRSPSIIVMSASGNYTPQPHVKRRDVMAALNVLGMKTDARAFWARAARRCKLRVYDKVRHRQVFGKRYRYVEVERILSSSIISDPENPEITAKDATASTPREGRTLTGSSASASEGSVSSDSMPIDFDGSSALSSDEDLSATSLDPANKQNRMQEGHDQLQDAYAEALDQQASRDEERRLWEMLGEDPAGEMEPVDVKLPKRPFPNQKYKEELLNWKQWVDYAGDWEIHETSVFRSGFANDQEFKEGVDSAAGLTSPGISSESLVNDESTEEEHDSD
ncbi:MAG: hypothetical protein Q9161_003615 [Pseudevernia consocians]